MPQPAREPEATPTASSPPGAAAAANAAAKPPTAREIIETIDQLRGANSDLHGAQAALDAALSRGAPQQEIDMLVEDRDVKRERSEELRASYRSRIEDGQMVARDHARRDSLSREHGRVLDALSVIPTSVVTPPEEWLSDLLPRFAVATEAYAVAYAALRVGASNRSADEAALVRDYARAVADLAEVAGTVQERATAIVTVTRG